MFAVRKKIINSCQVITSTTQLSQEASDMKYQLLFFPRKGKQKAETGKCPLYLRITCGSRIEVSLNKWVTPTKWNSKGQCLVGNTSEAKAINEFIKTVEVKLHNIHSSLLNKGELISAEVLKAYLLGNTGKQRTILDAFDYHLKHNEKNYSQATIKKYSYCKNHLKNYIWKNYNTIDVFLSYVDLAFIKEFQLYLSEESQFLNETGKMVKKIANDHNSTLKYLKMFKTIVTGAVAYKWLDSDPFALFKEKFRAVEKEYLNEDELRQIIQKEISIDRLKLVRDLFIFSCFTGLAYADLKNLSKEHLVIGIDGKRWINIRRSKTDTICKIPLLEIAESILKSYSTHPECINTGKLLPVCSNQKLNAYLKEIADLSGIQKNLTCHVARRTFTTVAIDNGVPAETIIKIIGHSGFKHLHLYAKTGDKKLAQDMEILRTKFGERAFEICGSLPLSKTL